ncbi:unnamed protein product [Diamesa tonsa]
MAFNLTRALCNRSLVNNVGLHKISPQLLNSARCITMKVMKAPAESTESHEEKNLRMNRPQSPHLTIYKMQLTSVLSITHRATGMALTGYAAILGLGAIALPNGVDSIVTTIEALQLSAPVLISAKFILAYPAAYHTVNGVRHLFWDMGKFLTIKEVYTTGYAMLLASGVMSAVLAIL